jgi:phosphatidylinositol 3-kinase
MDFVEMSAERRAMVWKFRYSQCKNKKMIVKFLQSVNWSEQKEMTEAMSLLNQWEQIDEEQALALLAGYFSVNEVITHMRVNVIFTNDVMKKFKEIRNYAVKCLRKLPDERVDLICLQLCQALRYEQYDESSLSTGLPKFLIDKSKENESIALHVHWNLYSEFNNEDLQTEVKDFYKMVYDELMQELDYDQHELYIALHETIEIRKRLLNCSNYVKSQTQVKVDGKTDVLRRELIGDGTGNHKMVDFGPNGLTCPLDPNVKLYGVIAKDCSVFKSAVQPMKMTFTARKFSMDK